MSKKSGIILVAALTFAVSAFAQQPCPGFDPSHNTNLACELATVTSLSNVKNTAATSSTGVAPLSATLAAQLSQLPIATAVSGSGLTFSKSLGVFTASNDSLGTILTQRGDTIGRHRWFLSFTYQRFGFGSIDGIRLKDLPTGTEAQFGSSNVAIFTTGETRVDMRVDQFAGLATFGLRDNLDLAIVVPFSKVTLSSSTISTNQFIVSGGTTTTVPKCQVSGSTVTDFSLAGGTGKSCFAFPGSATGLGDVTANVKWGIYRGEKTHLAIGSEVRFPTGDANNYLGTGAFGVKPYFVASRTGRITPNINVGYQWNGKSALFTDATTGAEQNLPSAFLYSGGADFRVTRWLTMNGEFVGQAVINGPKFTLKSTPIPNSTSQLRTLDPSTETYMMNNAGGGFKIRPFKGLTISASALFKLDDAGLRAKVMPLAGISYQF